MQLPLPTWTDDQLATFYGCSRRSIIRWRQAEFNLLDPADVMERLICQHSTQHHVLERVCGIVDELKRAAR